MKLLNYSLQILAILLLLSSCNNTGKNDEKKSDSATSMLQPLKFDKPVENLDIAFQDLTVNSAKTQVLEVSNGTKINVPADAFVDENGNPVKGEVTLQYRQIQSPGEIIASGVDMSYDSAGVSYDFQTGGMFELRGYANGKPVFIKDGKTIDVDYVSNIPGNYNLYVMDDKTGNWKYSGAPATAMGNAPEDKGTLVTLANVPFIPVKLDSKNDVVIEIKADMKKFPKLSIYKGIIWKYAGTKGKEEVMPIITKTWNNSNLVCTDEQKQLYKLTLTRGTSKEELEVQPVLSEKSFERAQEIYKKKLEEAKLQKPTANNNTAVLSPEPVRRTYPVVTFGMHNWDQIVKNPNLRFVEAKFKVGENLVGQNANVFLISGTDNVIRRFRPADFNKFNFDPQVANKLIVILQDKSVAVYSREDFKKLNINSVGQTPSVVFNLKTSSIVVDSPAKLDELIATL